MGPFLKEFVMFGNDLTRKSANRFLPEPVPTAAAVKQQEMCIFRQLVLFLTRVAK